MLALKNLRCGNTYICRMIITDLRSDTFTRPTPIMLASMMDAQVGDDVFHEDPSVNALEEMAASLFDMEAAVFCPSGTMTNQIAIKCHTEPGNEVICDKTSHVYVFEGGGIAFNSGCQVRTIDGSRGLITATQVEELVNPNDVHKPVSALVSLENTSNRGGGSCYDFADIEAIKAVCLKNNMKLHLDGARLFNALVAKQQTPAQYGLVFDSISICLSKGLGAPVGSLLLGNEAFIRKARRIRKVFGGGMRQAGYLATAGIYALEHHIDQLEKDHEHAKAIADVLIGKSFVGKMLPVETNILIFEVLGDYNPAAFCARLKEDDILAMQISPTQVRMVTHLDVSAEMVQHLLEVLHQM